MSRKGTKRRNSATARPGQATAEFDREFTVDTFRPLTAAERNRWARARVKRPRDAQGKAVSAIIISDSVRIPKSITDLASFRRWAYSDSFPEQGRISYLKGEIWVDLSIEHAFLSQPGQSPIRDGARRPGGIRWPRLLLSGWRTPQ